MNVYQRFLNKGDETYYGRYTAGGKRFLRNLGTPNREKALKVLRQLVAAAAEGRWAAIEKTKLRSDCATLGEVYAIYLERAQCNPKVRKNNRSAMRALLRGGRPEWADKTNEDLDKLTVRELTLELVSDFQRNLVAAAGNDNFKQDSAAITANSYFRQARSIFSAKLMPFYSELQLPDLRPFTTAPKLKEPEKKYVMPDPQMIQTLRGQVAQLKRADANAYRGWLLCLGSGLRRREAACARWSWVQPDPARKGEWQIELQTTEDFRTKSNKGRVVPLEAVAHAELSALRIPVVTQPGQKPAPDYILDGHATERYRFTFDRLAQWMKDCGWQRRKLTHELRKIFGSEVAAQAGIVAAQELLGHASILTTRQYYVGAVKLPRVQIIAQKATA